jgi:hypothetical protein
MTIEILQKELQQSIKDQNKARKNVIADIITCAKNAAIASGKKDEISEDIVTTAVLKSKKICQEQIDTCPANRPDVLEIYKLNMTYIDEFAPKMMSEEEVKDAVYFLLATVDMPTNNKGDIMKRIMPKLKGKADGKLINKVVTEILMESV